MTAQIHDRFILYNRKFDIVGVKGNGLFDSVSFGLHPVGVSSNCWRGYICEYVIQDEMLVLENPHISLGRFWSVFPQGFGPNPRQL